MIAGVFPAANMLVDVSFFQSLGKVGTEQEMVEPQTRVASIGISKIVPERVNALSRMHFAQRISPSLSDEVSVGFPDFDAEQRVVSPTLRLIDIQLRRHDVIVTHEDDRHL